MLICPLPNKNMRNYPNVSFDPFSSTGSMITNDNTIADGNVVLNKSNNSSINELQDKIMATPVYKQAYDLFSQKGNQYWLLQLEGIVQAVQPVTPRALNAKKVADANNKLFADAIQAITQLIRDYQQYVNTLPSTQVEQLSEAGINAAVTGAGVSSSEIGDGQPVDYQYPEISGDLETGLDFFNTVSSIFSAASGGITSFLNAFTSIGNLELSQAARQDTVSSALLQVSNSLSEFGVTGVPMFDSWSDFNKWYNEYGSAELARLNEGNSAKKLIYSDLLSIYSNAIRGRFYDGQTLEFSDNGERFINKVIEKGLESYLMTSEYKAAKNRYDYLYQVSLDPEQMAKLYTDQTKYQTDISEVTNYISQQKRKLWEFNERLIPDLIKDAKTPRERAILFRLLYNVSSSEFSQLVNQGTQNVGQGVRNVTGMVTDVTGAAGSVISMIP